MLQRLKQNKVQVPTLPPHHERTKTDKPRHPHGGSSANMHLRCAAKAAAAPTCTYDVLQKHTLQVL
jgi:hypothetical protein